MNSPICILQISDLHLLDDSRQTMMGIDTDQSLSVVLEALSDYPAELILATGDLVQDATASAYGRLQGYLNRLNAPCYCLPGNHDDMNLIGKHLLNDRILYRDRIVLEGWQIICLDSTIPDSPCGALAHSQIELLKKHLDDHADLFSLISLHHSAIPSGSAWLDTMLLDNAAEFFDLIAQYPQVKGVVFGHVHQSMDCEINHVRYLACPSTCFQFKPDSHDFSLDEMPQGFRCIKLHQNGQIETFVQRMAHVPDGLDLNSDGYA